MFSDRSLVILQRFFALVESSLVTRILTGFLYLVAFIALCSIGLWLARDHYRFGWNLTESLPHKLYLIKVGEMPSKNDYVAFRWQPKSDSLVNPYPNGVTFVKILAGDEGDIIEVVNREVFLNGVSVGYAKEKARSGLPLDARTSGVIAQGEMYVMGLHRDSLDSRYALVGNVNRSDVIGKAYAIF